MAEPAWLLPDDVLTGLLALSVVMDSVGPPHFGNTASLFEQSQDSESYTPH